MLLAAAPGRGRKSAVSCLLRLGVGVTVASSANEALAEMDARQAGPFDILLVDVPPRDVSALETVRRIKQHPGHAGTPCVLMLSDFQRLTAPEFTAASGVDGLLTKPVLPKRAQGSLCQVLGLTVGCPSRVKRAGSGVPSARDARVLLVEDNPLNQRLAMEMLSRMGLRVDVANNGFEALDRLSSEVFDLILLDIQMPLLDGYETIRRIREQDRFKDLPVVAMTACATEEEKRRCLDSGMNAHVAKPILMDNLSAVLARLLPGQEAAPGCHAETPAAHAVHDRDTLDRLLATPELDARSGAGFLGNDWDDYLDFLRIFLATHAATPKRLADSLECGDWIFIRQTAHNLRGTAPAVGADDLREIAAKVDGTAASPGTDEKQVRALSAELKRILDVIGRVLGEPAPEASCPPEGI